MDLMGTDDSNVCGSSSAKVHPFKFRAWWSTITTWWLNLNPFENAINSSHWIIPSQGGKQKSAHLWPFGGWKKSCTTWDVKHPVNSGINYQPQLVSRISEPSTAC